MFVVLGAGVEIVQHYFHFPLVQVIIAVFIVLIEELEDHILDFYLGLKACLLWLSLFVSELFLSARERAWPDFFFRLYDRLGHVARITWRGTATHFKFIIIGNHCKSIICPSHFAVIYQGKDGKQLATTE